MFSVFLSHVSSLWWEFSMEEYYKKVSESSKHPIIALMYAPWCPQCVGKPEKFKEFYKLYENNPNITFTLIDCKDRGWCFEQGARSIPHFVVIKGDDPFSWKYTNDHTTQNWKELVEEAIQGNVVRIENNRFGRRIVNTMYGSSYFHLVIQKDHTKILQEYKEIADRYVKYGCAFTYKYKPITKPSLRVYRSPFCMYKIKGKIDGFEWFMKSNKYSHMHQFTGDDMDDLNKSKPFALYVVDQDLQQPQFDNFMNLSKKYCKSVDFGTTLADTPKAYENFTKLTEIDAPFMVVKSFKHNCTLESKKKLLDGDRLGLYRHLANNKSCSSYREGWIRKRNPDTIMFLSLGFVATLAITGLFIEVRRLLISLKVE